MGQANALPLNSSPSIRYSSETKLAPHLRQVNVDLILGIRSLGDAIGESQVHFVELIPHLIGCHNQEVLNVIPQLGGGCPLTLGAENIVICKLGPRLRHGHPGNGKRVDGDKDASAQMVCRDSASCKRKAPVPPVLDMLHEMEATVLNCSVFYCEPIVY